MFAHQFALAPRMPTEIVVWQNRCLTNIQRNILGIFMTATNFESRHQTLVHMAIVAGAFATYVFERDDIVWRFVKHSAMPHLLERIAFFVATVLVGVGAAICTRTVVTRTRNSRFDGMGDIAFAIGVASLAPLSGILIFVGGQTDASDQQESPQQNKTGFYSGPFHKDP